MSDFRIILDDKYCIVDDQGRSYALALTDGRKSKVKGKEVLQDVQISWHATIQSAVQSYMRRKVVEDISGDMTLREFMTKYEEVHDKFISSIQFRDREGNPID